MTAARAAADLIRERGDAVYGMTTGVGALARVALAGDPEQHARRLILSHCVAHGGPAPVPVVRAAMLVRGQGLSLGGAGVRPAIVEGYLAALEAGFHPRSMRSGRWASRTSARSPRSRAR